MTMATYAQGMVLHENTFAGAGRYSRADPVSLRMALNHFRSPAIAVIVNSASSFMSRAASNTGFLKSTLEKPW
jgi:hypothetical protein